ncbi:2349_t:CDS:1, partial [Acaulospora morrowiae]
MNPIYIFTDKDHRNHIQRIKNSTLSPPLIDSLTYSTCISQIFLTTSAHFLTGFSIEMFPFNTGDYETNGKLE